jgi:molecular chaperone HscB
MNYFQLFQIPIQLKVDKNLIREKFFELSRQSHPDYFVNNTSNEQQNALELSALLNKAFKTFCNLQETIKYVLQQKGLLQDEEKYILPSFFLMEMMEFNEEVAEVQLDGDEEIKTKLLQQLTQFENEIYEPVAHTIENYQEGVTTEEELLQVKEYYFKNKYLHRLAQQLNQML